MLTAYYSSYFTLFGNLKTPFIINIFYVSSFTLASLYESIDLVAFQHNSTGKSLCKQTNKTICRDENNKKTIPCHPSPDSPSPDYLTISPDPYINKSSPYIFHMHPLTSCIQPSVHFSTLLGACHLMKLSHSTTHFFVLP